MFLINGAFKRNNFWKTKRVIPKDRINYTQIIKQSFK